jgi:hypothetical protein
MYKVLALSFSFISAHAIAASIPSILPDGKYDMACENITVEKYDSPAPGSSDIPLPVEVDSDGISRTVEYQLGTSVFLTSGNSTTIKDMYTSQSKDFSSETEDLTQRTTKAIGNNQFEESGTSTSTTIIKDNGEIKGTTHTYTNTWSRTLAVQGNFEVNLKAKSGDQPEAPGRGESHVTKNSDGSYTIISYIREGFRRERRELKNGAYTYGKFIYQTISNCKYAPMK